MRSILSVFLFISSYALTAQQNKDIINYVAQYKHVAIDEMVRTGIPASITMAQGILESGFGKSPLSTFANNHFGIKCKSEWVGQRYYQDDDEANECFRVYEHAEASYVDHSDFLLTRYRYAELFQLKPSDYKAWAYGLKNVGYATNPNYASILISYIENYNLHELDIIAMDLIEENNQLIGFSGSPVVNSIPAAVTIIEKPDTAFSPPNGTTGHRKEFTTNGVRAVRAIDNEDPLSIAFEFDIDYSFILSFNDLSSGDKFRAGENIFLQPKKLKGDANSCIVLPGESVRDVSQRMGVKLRELYAYNLLLPNEQVYPGETIFLKDKRASRPRTMTYAEFLKIKSDLNLTTPAQAALKPEPGAESYQVQKSDTLYSIARKFNTTVEELKGLNNLESNLLHPGQVLVIGQ